MNRLEESTVGLRAESWASMLEAGYVRTYGKGETILQQGELCRGLVCLMKGKVKASIIRHDGSEKIFGFYFSPSLIGEVATFDTRPNICNVTALSSVEILVIPPEKIKGIVKGHPEINQYIIESIGRKLRSVASQLENQAGMTVNQRIALFLESYNEQIYPDMYKKNAYLPLTQEEIASIIGASRQNVSLCLNEMEEKNILEIQRGKLRILDYDKLRLCYLS